MLMCLSMVQSTFTSSTCMNRRPIFHTFGDRIELPSTYEDNCDFRKEFTEIVTQQDIAIDII